MVNAVAIVTAGLIKGENPTERMNRLLELFRRYTGRDIRPAVAAPLPLCGFALKKGERAGAFPQRQGQLQRVPPGHDAAGRANLGARPSGARGV